MVFLPGKSQEQEPGGLPSVGLHGVGHDWSDLAAAVVGILIHLLGILEKKIPEVGFLY